MCFEVILPIVVALFAVFGLFCLFSLIGDTWYGSDNISVCLLVDTVEVADHLDVYLREASRKPLSRGGGITVLIQKRFANEHLLRKIRERSLCYYVLDMENKAE